MSLRPWMLGAFGLLCVIAFASAWFVTGEIGTVTQIAGVVGALSLVGYALVDRDALVQGASTREAGAAATSSLVLVLGAVLAVLSVALIHEHDRSWDLTSSGTWTLSPRTLSVLDGLDQDVRIHALFRDDPTDTRSVDVRRLLALYGDRSDRVNVEEIDPLMQPARAMAVVQATGQPELDQLAATGTILLTSGERRRRIESRFDQTSITNALVKLTSGEDHRICWSIGHGERDADDDQSPRGFGALVLRLEDRNATVTESRILTEGVDRACEVLVIAGPRADFTASELEAVAAYVAEGGDVLLLLDNPVLEAARTPLLDDDLGRYGLSVADAVIVATDPDHVVADAAGEPMMAYFAEDFVAHPITESLEQAIFVRWPRSITPSGDSEGRRVQTLLTSTARSWAELRLDPTLQEPPTAEPDEAVGPVPFAALVEITDPDVLDVFSGTEADDTDASTPFRPRRSLVPADFRPRPGGRILVLGDSDLGDNTLSAAVDDGALLLGSIAWMLGETDQLGADASEAQLLTLTTSQLALVFLLAALLVPGGAAAAGILLLVRRRYL